MNKGKRVRPASPTEYRLLITQKYDDRTKEMLTVVGIRTIIEFENFHYEIVVVPTLADRTLTLRIEGLRAPRLTIPGTGPASYITEFRDLHGTYTVIVSKLSREENQYEVDIRPKKVVTIRSPIKRFVDLVTSEEEW